MTLAKDSLSSFRAAITAFEGLRYVHPCDGTQVFTKEIAAGLVREAEEWVSDRHNFPAEIAGAIKSKQLTLDQLSAIRSYTADNVCYIVRQLTTSDDPLVTPFIELLLTGLRNLPSSMRLYAQYAYRVEKSTVNRVNISTTQFQFHQLTSFTLDRDVAAKFVERNEKAGSRSTVFVARGVAGYRISAFSLYPGEEEILVEPGACFKMHRLQSNHQRADLFAACECSCMFQPDDSSWWTMSSGLQPAFGRRVGACYLEEFRLYVPEDTSNPSSLWLREHVGSGLITLREFNELHRSKHASKRSGSASNLVALSLRGISRFMEGNYAAAAEDFHFLERKVSTKGLAWNNLGAIYISRTQKHVGKARKYFEKATSIAPWLPCAWFNLALTLHHDERLRQERAQKTTECLVKCLELDPHNSDAWSLLGDILSPGRTVSIAGQFCDRTDCFTFAECRRASNLSGALKLHTIGLEYETDEDCASSVDSSQLTTTFHVMPQPKIVNKAEEVNPSRFIECPVDSTVNRCSRRCSHYSDSRPVTATSMDRVPISQPGSSFSLRTILERVQLCV